MQVIKDNLKTPIFSWCPDIEEGALNQAKLLVEQPFVFKHMALMPDAHQGMTMPIGGVLATKNVILPACVGNDIGCGMCAVKTSLKVENFTTEKKEELLHSIERSIPVGFEHNNDKRQSELLSKYGDKIDYLFEKNKNVFSAETQIFKDLRKEVAAQLATLGGG